MIGAIDEGDLDEQSENGSNDTFDLEGAVTIEIKTTRISPLIRIQTRSHVRRPQATSAGKRKPAILGFGDFPDLLRDFCSQRGSETRKRCRNARIEGAHSVRRPRAQERASRWPRMARSVADRSKTFRRYSGHDATRHWCVRRDR